MSVSNWSRPRSSHALWRLTMAFQCESEDHLDHSNQQRVGGRRVAFGDEGFDASSAHSHAPPFASTCESRGHLAGCSLTMSSIVLSGWSTLQGDEEAGSDSVYIKRQVHDFLRLRRTANVECSPENGVSGRALRSTGRYQAASNRDASCTPQSSRIPGCQVRADHEVCSRKSPCILPLLSSNATIQALNSWQNGPGWSRDSLNNWLLSLQLWYYLYQVCHVPFPVL